jgi:DNA (cytosine-5)-methyltransferase 1
LSLVRWAREDVVSEHVLLDAFCCQGGASMGYARAGFTVYGIDIDPQPRYPFPFHQGDAIEALDSLASGRGVLFTYPAGGTVELFEEQIVAKHGSPPCQAYTLCQRIQGNDHPDLIEPTRELFEYARKPYVIENVEGAPLLDPVMLCGAMFGLETYRHRLFESSLTLSTPAHPEHVARTTKMGRTPVPGEFMHIVGNFSGVDRGREVMGMEWATRDGLREAIPPAYTEHIGRQLRAHLAQEAAA